MSDADPPGPGRPGEEDTAGRPPSLLALPTYLAGHVARIGHDRLVADIAAYGLRLPHFATLTALADFGPLPQHALADHLGFNRSHLVGYLDTVEERGLVGRTRDPADRRRQLVALTAEGRRLQRRLLKVAERAQEEFLRELSATERETLAALLRRIVAAGDRRTARTDD
ncbi:MarR family transcriptional regulator [Streptomyces sp. WAC 06738]|uniref:MarR family winged helix-turn-helix transcriptional regulator n=1 Tax=Streptomyces sp. WAC 06738 TaxID=2203210 RepID=UPI000F6E610E|nr:MarR family transcriptional regulator [Streptomyces sp. WAC 06738]AZM46624.1 MarR family transcriptional regulator [Streptomyces sp. WAC 06738]